MMLVDSHCHLDFPDLVADLDAVLARMRDAGVGRALCVAVNLEDFPAVRNLAALHEGLYASVGVHPDHRAGDEPTEDQLAGLAECPEVVAIGETGLDYYRQDGDLEWQRERFRQHIRAARRVRKPLIIHCRDAADDLLAILDREGAADVGGVMHCFTGTWDVARAAMEMNFLISFSGIVTFKSAGALREVAARVPLDRMLVETDSPYLAPVPHRGKRNEPAWVRHVAEEVARIRAIPLEQVAARTTENFIRLFNVM